MGSNCENRPYPLPGEERSTTAAEDSQSGDGNEGEGHERRDAPAKVSGNAGATSFSIYPPKRTVASTTAGRTYTGGAYLRSATPGRSVCLRIREWNGTTLIAAKAICRTTTTA